MRNYTDEEIEAYIASGDPFDKAGAYAIQNPDFQPVERIEGCYCCVVGLPVCRVVRALARFGLTPPERCDGRLPDPSRNGHSLPGLPGFAAESKAAGANPEERKNEVSFLFPVVCLCCLFLVFRPASRGLPALSPDTTPTARAPRRERCQRSNRRSSRHPTPS